MKKTPKHSPNTAARASVAPLDLAPVTGGSGSNTVFVPRRNGETGIL